MSGRRAFLDESPGERRGVVTLEGRPERLWIERDGAARRPRLGSRYAGRVTEVSPALQLARVELGEDGEGSLAIRKTSAPTAGALIEAEVAAEPRAGKPAQLRLIGPGSGAPRRLVAPALLEDRLAAAAGGDVRRGADAREAADEAEEAALAREHRLPGGLVLTVEPTRALVAVDVDWGRIGGVAGRRLLGANLEAVREAARLLRLKALGGTIVIDLIGFPADPEAVREAARQAFAPDGPGVSVLPVSRLGLLQVGKPHRETPAAELLCGPDGEPTARSLAQRLVRALEREGRAQPGARIAAAAAAEVARELGPLVAALGPRFSVVEEAGWPVSKTDIRVS